MGCLQSNTHLNTMPSSADTGLAAMRDARASAPTFCNALLTFCCRRSAAEQPFTVLVAKPAVVARADTLITHVLMQVAAESLTRVQMPAPVELGTWQALADALHELCYCFVLKYLRVKSCCMNRPLLVKLQQASAERYVQRPLQQQYPTCPSA